MSQDEQTRIDVGAGSGRREALAGHFIGYEHGCSRARAGCCSARPRESRRSCRSSRAAKLAESCCVTTCARFEPTVLKEDFQFFMRTISIARHWAGQFLDTMDAHARCVRQIEPMKKMRSHATVARSPAVDINWFRANTDLAVSGGHRRSGFTLQGANDVGRLRKYRTDRQNATHRSHGNRLVSYTWRFTRAHGSTHRFC